MEKVKFVYLGEDEEFLKQIQVSLDKFYKDINVKIDKKSFKTMKDAREFIHSKETQAYSLFIVDFSANFPIYAFTAQVLGFQNNYKNIPLLGLIGIEGTENNFLTGIIAGCKAIFVKGIEISSMVNFSIQLYNPKYARPIKWATGEFAEDEVEAFACFKLGYFTNEYLHVESNLELPLNEEIVLKTKIANNIGANKFKVLRQLNTNQYYNLERNYDLEILAPSKRIDPNMGLTPPDKKEPPGKVEGKALELFKDFKNKLSKWIDDHTKDSKPKRTKVLMIDEDLSIFIQIEKNPDDYPFFIMAHRYLTEDLDSIKKSKADFIVFVIDESSPESKNRLELVPKIIQKSQEIPGYTPFIFLYKCDLSQKELQTKFNYGKILTYQDSFDFNFFAKMVEKFEASNGRDLTHNPEKSHSKNQKRFYLNKVREDSFGFHPFKIRITGINETTITFKTTYKLDDFFVLKLEFPSPMWITVLPKAKDAKTKEKESYLFTYSAAINGIGEIEKNRLRVYINKVFVPKEEEPEKKEKKAS